MDVVSDQMLPELEEIDRPPGPGPGLMVREADDYPGVMSPRLHHNNFISLGPPPPIPLMEYQAPDQTSSNFTQTFLRGILTSIDSKDPVVANAWLETLLDAIDLLPIEVIKQEIIIIAINKSQLSQPPFSRIASCKILGKLSTKLDQQANRQEILPSSLALCQDVEAEVRNVMCRHLAFVARGVGLELTKSAILPVLVELSNDESAEVRLSAIETVVHLLSLLDDEVCTNTIVPLVMKSCGQARTLEDCTLPVIARHLGRLCHGLSPNLSQEQKAWFISFYQQLAKLGTDSAVTSEAGAASAKPMPDLVPRSTEDKSVKYTECRQACAYNLPGMVLFVGAQNFSEKLFSTFCDFAADSSPAVRKTLAASLHELIKIIGTNFCLLKMQIVALFNDNNMDVLSSMVFNMVYIIDGLARFGVLQFGSTSGYSQELSLAILHMEEVINNTRNWRLHADCLEKLSCLANCISAAVIQHRYIPLLFTRAHKSRPLPTRTAAVRTLLVILRFTVKQEDRNSITQRIKTEFARGKSSHSRMLYLKMSEMAICLFSKLYFKQNFFTELLCLSQDPVANIRLKVVSLLPQLKGLLMMPGDSGLLLHLEDTIKELLVVETDRDVLGSLQTSIQHLAEIETALEGISKLGLYSEEDIVDDRKLREEKLIANMEEQIKQVQGAKFEQLMSPSAIPSRLRSLGAMERKRSESLPPALTRPEAGARPRYSSPEPQMLRGQQEVSEAAGSSDQAKLSSYSPHIWPAREDERFEEKDFKVKTGLSTATPFSSSLENLDTQEFLVDAGIKLPSAASLPNLTSVGKTKDGLIRSNSIPDNSSVVDGELAKYLISNEEMEHYEAEYHKAAQEVQIDPSDLGTTLSMVTTQNNNEATTSGAKARGRSETKMRPPSFTSALINRAAPSASATVESITISKSPVSFSKPIQKAEKQEVSLTPPKPLNTKTNQSLRNSPPKLDERVLNQQPRWNDGSIERLAEKWAAKRDALLKETGVIGENLQQRKAEMEQKLESVKRSIPKRSFATASKRLSLVETSSSSAAVSNKETSRREPKRKSLDADVVLKDAESDEEVSDKSQELPPPPPAPAGLVRKPSPEAGSSDSDDSLPPYPAMMADKQNLDVDQPLPPPPELSIDAGFHNSGRESKLKSQSSAIGTTGSRLQLFSTQSSSRSSMATFKKVSAPQTSVAVSRQLQAPKRSIADSPKLPLPSKPQSDKLSPPSKLNAANTNRNSSSDAKNLDELKSSEANKNSNPPDMKTTINTVNHQSQSKMNDSPSSNLSSQSSKIKLFSGAKKPSEDYSQQSATSSHPSSLLQINRSPNKRVSKASTTTQIASGQFSSFKGPSNGATDTKTQARGGKTVVYIETSPKPSSAGRQESKLSSLRSPSLKYGVSKSDSSPGQDNGQMKTFQSKLSQRGAGAQSNGDKSKSSSPSGSCENLLSPSNPSLGTKTAKSGLMGPRRSSGVRLFQGRPGPSPGPVVKQLQPPNVGLSRSPSPSLQRVGGQRSGEAVSSTLPRGSASRMRAPASATSQQRRSYGGVTASPGMMRSGLAKHSSAPNTPRHSQADLSGGRGSPGGSRSASPVILRQPRQQQPPSSSDNQFRNPAPSSSSSVPVSRFSAGSSMLRRPSSSSSVNVQHDDRPARPSSYNSRPSGLSSSSLSRTTEPSRSLANNHHNQQQSIPAPKSRLPNPPKSFGYSY